MWPFSKPLERLEERDLVALIGVRENQALEFKEVYDRRDPQAPSKMLRDVSAMANAEGGALIIGMAADADEVATRLVPVPDAETEATRLVQICDRGLQEQITGLRTYPVRVAGGHAIVVFIPKSYRKPHVVVANEPYELWTRHDRRNTSMSLAEIRDSVLVAEDLEMKVTQFLLGRREELRLTGGFLVVTATPLSLQGGRVDVHGPNVLQLLEQTDRRGGGFIVLTRGYRGRPTLNGRRVELPEPPHRLEIFRNGHVESVLIDRRSLLWDIDNRQVRAQLGDRPILHSGYVAEYIFRVVQLARQVAEAARIDDPSLLGVTILSAGGLLRDSGSGQRGSAWNETRGDLVIEPVLLGLEEPIDVGLKRVLDSLWNAFGHEACLYFDENGRFTRPRAGV